MTDVWLFVFCVPWLVMLWLGPRLERRLERRRGSSVDLGGHNRREVERFPRSLP